jgi:hypothetical protein
MVLIGIVQIHPSALLAASRHAQSIQLGDDVVLRFHERAAVIVDWSVACFGVLGYDAHSQCPDHAKEDDEGEDGVQDEEEYAEDADGEGLEVVVRS